MRGILGFVVILLLALFLLSNRDDINLALWPFGFIAAVPLGVVVLVALLLGLVLGWLAHLPARLAVGRRLREAKRNNVALAARPAVVLPPEP